MRRRNTITLITVGIAVVVAVRLAVAAGGGALNDPQETYSNSWLGKPSDGVVASVSVQLVSYDLNSVAGKYKLIPVLLRADARSASLALSISQDRLVVISGGQRVSASFQLSALDRTLWDSLAPATKNWLSYPEQLRPNSAVMVYAFVLAADLKGRLEGFEYTLASLPAPLKLQAEPKKKAAALGRHLVG
jgi:hypothetical protein